MIQNFPLISQNDPRWAKNKLGSTTNTIGGYGCLITCICMLLTYYGKKTNPDEYNAWLTANGGYDKGDLYYWSSASKYSAGLVSSYLGKQVDGLMGADWDRINVEIAAGRPVVLRVDFKPATETPDMHFVVYLGDNTIADPWTGRLENISKYGGEKKVLFYDFHKGTPVAGGSMNPQEERDYRNFNWEVGVQPMLDLADMIGVGKPASEAKPANKADWATFAQNIKKKVQEFKDKPATVQPPAQGEFEAAYAAVGRMHDKKG